MNKSKIIKIVIGAGVILAVVWGIAYYLNAPRLTPDGHYPEEPVDPEVAVVENQLNLLDAEIAGGLEQGAVEIETLKAETDKNYDTEEEDRQLEEERRYQAETPLPPDSMYLSPI